MLAIARTRGIYERLEQADVSATGLEDGAYDLITTGLVDEHLPDLQPLYREASRLLRPGGVHVLIGYHPHFIMTAGMPTHFDRRPGEPVAIETYVHLLSDHGRRPRGGAFAHRDARTPHRRPLDRPQVAVGAVQESPGELRDGVASE